MDENRYTQFTKDVLVFLKRIPYGKVTTYGDVAKTAGYPNGTRQVVSILSSLSEKENLPWHRVVNKAGQVVLKGEGEFEQITLLQKEGVGFINENIVDMKNFKV
ncbi:MAG: MGMT family protein [Clostridia bacterium]|nr:MGMT family protein [Clostridia bacterium]